MPDYLHNHKDFESLLNILGNEMNVEPGLIEKDYWIMHVLFGLKQQGFQFELKGGTSLSKGYKLINRFSEDIDIHIKPPKEFEINENPKNTNEKNVKRRKNFYDWLTNNIKIPDIISVERDTDFDDKAYYRSGGIRLYYENLVNKVDGIKDGILLEAGFDTVTPNNSLTISSWAMNKAQDANIDIIDNTAHEIACYHAGYTLVEKLQTIATKFRNEQENKKVGANFMRQYYDVHCLLNTPEIIDFIGCDEYVKHKEVRFPAIDFNIPISENEAFLLSSKEIRDEFTKRYNATSALYYQGQLPFEEVINGISKHLKKL
jgi:hypothetical protein